MELLKCKNTNLLDTQISVEPIPLCSFFRLTCRIQLFLNYIELRSGTSLRDPILDFFSPHDMTWLTFFLIYFSLTIGILSLYRHRTLFAFLHAYSCSS